MSSKETRAEKQHNLHFAALTKRIDTNIDFNPFKTTQEQMQSPSKKPTSAFTYTPKSRLQSAPQKQQHQKIPNYKENKDSPYFQNIEKIMQNQIYDDEETLRIKRYMADRKIKLGAQIDFDVFFTEKTGCNPPIVNPPFSKTKLSELEKAKPLFEIFYKTKPQKEVFQQKEENTFLTSIQHVKTTHEEFADQLNNQRADYIQVRKESLQEQQQPIFEKHQEMSKFTQQYNQLNQQNVYKKQKLDELLKQQKTLLVQNDIQHSSLQDLIIQVQRHQELKPLFEALHDHFPNLQPTDVINKLQQLNVMNKQLNIQNSGIQQNICQLENQKQQDQTNFIRKKFELYEKIENEVNFLTKEVEIYQKLNKELDVEVKKASEIQQKYLQVCQDITAFWIGIGKMYGNQLLDELKPSVNNPIEVLRAADTVLSIVYPDAAQSQENFKRIAAACSQVWSRLLVNAPNAEALRSDFECVLARAAQFYKASMLKLQNLQNILQQSQTDYDQLKQIVEQTVQSADAVVGKIRKFGQNTEQCDAAVSYRK